jgi:hypothetical protein
MCWEWGITIERGGGDKVGGGVHADVHDACSVGLERLDYRACKVHHVDYAGVGA